MSASDWLKDRGWYVVPSYDYSGSAGDKAPRLMGKREGFAVPDLDIAKAGKRMWVEVKVKSGPTLHRLSGTYEHGISRRLFNGYQRVETITGCQVWMMVIEEVGMGLLGRALADLGTPRVYSGDKMGWGGMVFWPRERFKFLATLAKLETSQQMERVV